jgi:hypothetical protein
VSEELSHDSVWALAAAGARYPDMVSVWEDVPYAPGHAVPEVSRRAAMGVALRCAEVVGLANTYGGYLIFGMVPGNPPGGRGVYEFRLDQFERLLAERLRAFGLRFPAVRMNRVAGVAVNPVMVVRVEKLNLPLLARLQGRPTVPRMSITGLVYEAISGPVERARYAVAHHVAVTRRGALRRSREALRQNAPRRITSAAERIAAERAVAAAARVRLIAATKPASKPAPRLATPRPPDPSPEIPLPELLTWEVLPEESLDLRWMNAFHESNPSASPYERREHFDRLRFLRSLGPLRWFEGRRLGQRVYFVLVFGSLVIADSPQYGNALYYYIGPDWQAVFSLSKSDARAQGARRAVHTGEWEGRIRVLVDRFR